MIWRLIAVLLLFAQPGAQSSRGLVPRPEPDVIEAAVIERIYVPMVLSAEVVNVGDAQPVYGYATPHRRSYDVPFYNWHALPQFCTNANYWPMVRGQDVASNMGEACDNGRRMLLIYNEPELGHYSATPRQAVGMVEQWRADWDGPIACCGNFYGRVGGTAYSGLEWMLTLIEEYHIAHGVIPPIDAVHMHVYQVGGVDEELLVEWRALADAYGWQLIVSESGVSTALTPDAAAQELPIFLAQVETILRPDVLMWFSDYLQPWVLGDGTAWHNLNLTNVDGSLTPVGEAWQVYTGTTIDGARAGQR